MEHQKALNRKAGAGRITSGPLSQTGDEPGRLSREHRSRDDVSQPITKPTSRECLCQRPVRKVLQRRTSRTAVIRHRQPSSTDFSDLGLSQFGVVFLNSAQDGTIRAQVVAHEGRAAADRGEYRQAAGAPEPPSDLRTINLLRRHRARRPATTAL